MKRVALAFGLLLPPLLLAFPACAADGAPPKEETHRIWYGWQTLLLDGALVGTYAGIAAAHTGDSSAYQLAPLLAMPLAGPVVHLAHDRPATAALSLGIRLGAPLALAVPAYLLTAPACDKPGSDWCGLGVLAVTLGAAMVGELIAVVIDAAALGWKEVPAAPKALRVTPTASVGHGGGSVGLAGSF
jgi:hypothetical protein